MTVRKGAIRLLVLNTGNSRTKRVAITTRRASMSMLGPNGKLARLQLIRDAGTLETWSEC